MSYRDYVYDEDYEMSNSNGTTRLSYGYYVDDSGDYFDSRGRYVEPEEYYERAAEYEDNDDW